MKAPDRISCGRLAAAAARLTLAACLGWLPAGVFAELVSLEILRREPYAGGASFGETGPYESITALAFFEVDPALACHAGIADLDLAPRNARGRVEFSADVSILAPRDAVKGNGAVLYDVNNRGGKLAPGFFNGVPAGEPGSPPPGEAGNGFLFRRGYTVAWCGWIGELLPASGRLLLRPPPALVDGKPVRGPVRYEMVSDGPADSMPLSRRPGHGSYSPTERGEAEGSLTWRQRETDPRVPIPKAQWTLERSAPAAVPGGAGGSLGEIRLRLRGGFRPGAIYELICEAEGSLVQGCGYLAVRDFIAFLRYENGGGNPLARDGRTPIQRAYGFGVSQSGRFLRNFLYLGLNGDERGRPVFDALLPHVAGGGLGFFNHRFAQPTRHNGQHEEHLYPGDRFPFAYGDAVDPFSGRIDGILRRARSGDPRLLPKIFHTQTSAEYWHRSGSLVHTDPRGEKDAELPENVRVYVFGGAQHGPAGNPPERGLAQNLLNPADYRPLLRALLDALDAWVKDDKAPPPSIYPRIDQETLVPFQQASTGFPGLPGVRYPEVIQQPQACDYGPEFESRGIIALEPPRVLGGYRVLVPRCDASGNDLGALLIPEVAVPLATYTGWNLRRRDAGAEDMLASLSGSFFPFSRTRAEREAAGDPRPSIEERYGGFEAYDRRFRSVCDDLVKRRYLLAEDAERLIRSRELVKDRFPAR